MFTPHRFFSVVTLLLALPWSPATPAFSAEVISYFSPRGGAAQAICNRLDAATTSIDVAAFQLTYRPFLVSLISARERGVVVRIVVDPSQESYAHRALQTLRGPNLDLRTDRLEKIQHNKYAVVDGLITITGSYNWTNNAENRNAENLVIIIDEATASSFTADFDFHFRHSVHWLLKQPRTVMLPSHPRRPFQFLSPAQSERLIQWHALLAL